MWCSRMSSCSLILVLVYLFVSETESSVRHGFPPDYLHVDLQSELQAIRRPQIITLKSNDASDSEAVNDFNSVRRKRDVKTTPATQTAAAKGGNSTAVSVDDDDESKNITIKVNALNDSHAQLMVHWLGDGSEVMICLARDPPLGPQEDPQRFPQLSPSFVYFSYDYGDTFINKTHLFKVLVNGTEQNSTLDQFMTHPKFDTIIFTDSRNKAIFHVPDRGDDVKRYMLDFTPSDISFYENDAKTFLVLDKEDPEHKLYYTTDAGASFNLLETHVKSYSWSSGEGLPTHLYVERREPTNTSSVIFMNAADLLKMDGKRKFNLLIENVQDFHIKKDFMFATRRALNTTQLWICYRRGSFVKADFQTELNILGFHIADVEDRRIFVAAAHSHIISHLYVSEGNSNMTDIKFVPSLENVFTYIPNVIWASGWLAQTADEAFTELYKVEGITGIYIASKLTKFPTFGPGIEAPVGPEHLVSVISFDFGTTWRPIAAPKVDDEGQLINCTKDCSLHLSQKFSQLYPVTRSVSIMSSKLAPGVIMATGVVGKSIKGHPGVFLSRDAGLTWKQILKTYHFFNFGDHGGILVAVKYFKTKGETREILYSTDEGEKWHSKKFHSSDLKVYGLMTEPNSNTTIFTLFGSEVLEHRWLIIKVDLRNAFSYNCTQDDYKFWSPSSQSGESLTPCLLGKQKSYQRRVPHTNCYNGKDYDRPTRTEICQCNHWDFTCDFGFSRMNSNSPCVYNKSMALIDPYKIPEYCKPGEFYHRTRGYRKIEADACVGGFESRYLPQKLPCPFGELNSFILVAQRDRISRINLMTNEKEVVPIEDLKNVIALDFDMKHNCIFYADIMSDKIVKQCLDGSKNAEVLVETELASVEGMSYDWVSEMLFFVDGTRSKIEAVKTSNDSLARVRVTIIDSNKLIKPRGIVVHPIEGYLFWTEWSNTKPSISRANMDGSDIRILFTKPDVVWPNGITIDYFAQRVYWVDASKDYIASCDLNGKSFIKVLQHDSRVSHPFAVAVFKDLMYWDDWKINSIFSADKDHGIMVKAITNQMNNLMDMKIYAHSLQEGTNACLKSHNCTHVCVGAPKGGYTCLCPDGMQKSPVTQECLCPGGLKPNNNKTCPQLANTCAPGYFTCNTRSCIPSLYRCDGEDDCGDNSDEVDCSSIHPACPPHMFTCKSDNKCIPEYFACDYDLDCDDGSDEKGCKFNECFVNEFRCANGRCISQKWHCDGEDDCRDGSDEVNCPEKNVTAVTCKPDEFRCTANKFCIPEQWRCDSDYDCSDGADETDCNTKVCEQWEYDCGDGKCIYKTWRCDGDKDCANGADEENCTTTMAPNRSMFFPTTTCHDWMFRCNNNKCIPMWWKCDKVNDCGDQSDEVGCGNEDGEKLTTRIPFISSTSKPNCSSQQFECDSGACISKRYVCDGSPDCANGEDERNCPTDTNSFCGPGSFQCRSNHVCLPISKHCDKVINCADGSDEEDCFKTDTIEPEPKLICGPEKFACDHMCIPLMALCDNKQDCYDGTDEEDCSKRRRVYQIESLSIGIFTLDTTSFELGFWTKAPGDIQSQLEYLPSISLAGTDAWQNHTTWLKEKRHRFMNLKPFTSYNVTVYVRKHGEETVPPYIFKVVTTLEGVPSEPLNVNVTQLNGSRVQVSWDAPKEINGILRYYTVYYRPQTTTIARPALSVKVSSQEHSIVLESYFKGNVTYDFWVRAHNTKYEGPNSNMVHLTFDDVSNMDSFHGVTAKFINNTVVLTWPAVKGAEGYIVQPSLQQPYPKIQQLKTNDTKMEIKNMIAGVQYTIRVSAFVKNYVGRPETIQVTFPGEPLPEVPHITIQNTYDQINLKWETPNTHFKNITYGVYYGTTLEELFEKPRITTSRNEVNLTDALMPCEYYLISVGIIGPVGPGPLGRSPITLETNLNDKKPPRKLAAKLDMDKKTITLTWQHNCPQTHIYPSYLITVKELVLNKTRKFELKRSTNTTLTHYFDGVARGAIYNISVQTNTDDSEPATVTVKTPELYGPRQLRVWPERNGTFVVYWKELESMPKDLNFTYELIVYSGLWSNRTAAPLETVTHFRSKTPPILVNPDHLGGADAAGKIFTFGIRLITGEGYMSEIAETESVEIQPDAAWFSRAIPSSSYGWIAIPVIIVLVLVGVIVYLMQRHKRLQNSFSRFANSHYDTKTGATRIGDTFDDDEQHHQEVPRFADDEPLVIA